MSDLYGISDGEYERLELAYKTKKYGHLQSWKELYWFQRLFPKTQQCVEIGKWAARVNNGETVLLPLMKNA